MDEMNNQVSEKKNGIAIAGFVVGLVSILINFYGITGIVGLILSIIGLKKSKETQNGKGLAIAGICCSVIGLIIGIFAIVAIIKIFSIVGENANDIDNALKTINSLNY